MKEGSGPGLGSGWVCTPGPHTSSREHAAICVNIGVVSLATIHNVTIILQRSMIYTMNLT